jgi:hypothetical protein
MTSCVPVNNYKDGNHDREGKYSAIDTAKYQQIAWITKIDSCQVYGAQNGVYCYGKQPDNDR